MDKKEYWFRLIGVSIVIIAIAIYIGWKQMNPDIDTKNALIITGVISLLGVVTVFGSNISKMFETSEDKIPKAMTEEQMKWKIQKEVERLRNMVRKDNAIVYKYSRTINKNEIYFYHINVVRDVDFGDIYGRHRSLVFIINANYPEMEITILPPTVSDEFIQRCMNYKSKSPDDEPDIVETETSVDEFNRPVQKTRQIQHKAKETKESVV